MNNPETPQFNEEEIQELASGYETEKESPESLTDKSKSRLERKFRIGMKWLQEQLRGNQIDKPKFDQLTSELNRVCETQIGKEIKELSPTFSEREILGAYSEITEGWTNLNMGSVFEVMGGLVSQEAQTIRRKHWDKNLPRLRNHTGYSVDLTNPSDYIGNAFSSLAGVDTLDAWKMRYEIRDELDSWRKEQDAAGKAVEYKPLILRSLAGLDTEESWKIREQYSGRESLSLYLQSLVGLDSPKAWQKREEAFTIAEQNPNNFTVGSLLSTLSGLGSERAWQFRDKVMLLKEKQHPDYKRSMDECFSTGLAYVTGERVKKHQEFLESNNDIWQLLHTLTGDDSKKAWDLRRKYKDKKEYHHPMAYSITGLHSQEAKEMREWVGKDTIQYSESFAGHPSNNPRIVLRNHPDIFFNEE